MGVGTRRWFAALSLLAVVLTTGPVSAQQTTPTAPVETETSGDQLPPWQRALYKTITYQAMGNVSDLLFYQALIGGTPVMTGSFMVANAVSGFSLYYGFEHIWNNLVPPPEDRAARSLVEKTLLYRSLNTSKNFVLSYAYSGSVALASVYVASTFVSDTVIFVGNEYLWNTLRPRGPS